MSALDNLIAIKKCSSCYSGLKCTVCGGAGEISRPLTEQERGEFNERAIKYYLYEYEPIDIILSTGIKVRRKK